MVDLTLLQPISWFAASIGVCVAAVYYVLNLRITQKNQELSLKAQQQTLETRQAQFFMQLYQRLNNTEAMEKWIAVMNMQWSDYDDYEKKYGTDTNPEGAALRLGVLYEWNGVGYLLKMGVIDREAAYRLANNVSATWLWKKYEPVIREMRVRYNIPEAFSELEYLMKETEKALVERGFSPKVPDEFAHYTGQPVQ